ncbi:MAG: UDP-N-acetylmuramate--L-alanine ligase [Saprospiraceae bacterium]|nr:UDP-N-acetylmuramate--L-alanine ligase [Saprospiraceae bacterium]
MNIQSLKHVYFIGIGGIGMSAIARYFYSLGIKVSGYDKTLTELTSALVEEGMNIHFDDNEKRVPEDVDLVVYTPAIPADHLGLQLVKKKGIPLMKRAQVLGLISTSRYCIAIAGTHGKTTTSTLTAHVMFACGMDPSAFLGGISVNTNSNYMAGKSDFVVLEADEFDRSFLHLEPDIAAIMSMDADHLDIYGKHEDMLTGFVQFARKIKVGGHLLIKSGLLTHFSAEDLNFLENRNIKIREFGEKNADLFVTNVLVRDGRFYFDLTWEGKTTRNWETNLPGKHNVENASVAIAIGMMTEGKTDDIRNALRSFAGIKRRFEFIFKSESKVYIDDYAHHPTELNAAISGVKMLYPDKKITGIFQPHLYSRTRDFYEGFAEALDRLDEIFLMEIYPARELPIEGVTSSLIFEKMKNRNKKLVSKINLMDNLDWENLEVLVTLGAGDIDTFVPKISEKLNKIK